MAASYDPDPMQFLGSGGPSRSTPVKLSSSGGRIGCGKTPSSRNPSRPPRRLKALSIDCGEKDQFNLRYGARRFVRRLNELGVAHRCEEFPDNILGSTTGSTRACPFSRGAVRLTDGSRVVCFVTCIGRSLPERDQSRRITGLAPGPTRRPLSGYQPAPTQISLRRPATAVSARDSRWAMTPSTCPEAIPRRTNWAGPTPGPVCATWWTTPGKLS
jgi:hypothetical protein